MELVRAFNKKEIVRGIVRVNRPSVWHFRDNCGPSWAGKACLDERYIEANSRRKRPSGPPLTMRRHPTPIFTVQSNFSAHSTDRIVSVRRFDSVRIRV